jgi:isoquinoline 1-oxidoreductase beta subunit
MSRRRCTWSSTTTALSISRRSTPRSIEGIRKQIEGAAIYGNTIARHGKITTTKGAVDQSNFHDYPITRVSDAPLDVRVHIVEDFVHLRPCGVGEPGVPPYAPALINAIYDATGKRIRTLPIGDQLKKA